MHGCLQIWSFSSRVQLEDKFYSYARHVLFSAYRTLLRLFVIQLLRQYLAHLQDSFSFDITLVSHALLGFFFIQLLRWYLVLLQDSFSSDCYVSVLWNFQGPFSFDCDVRIVRTIRILLHSVVKLVSRGLLRFFFILLLCQYLTHFYIFSFNGNASFVCTFTILFFFGLFFISFLRLYFAHLKEILLLDCCGSISRHFRDLFHWIVTLASRRRLGSFFHLIVTLVP